MAIVYSSAPSYFAANPKILRFTGVKPGTRGTFVFAITEQQNDPSVGQYVETIYKYADANGVIEIDVSPIRQRGAASVYTTPLVATGSAVWSRNLYTYFELAVDCSLIDADDDTEESFAIDGQYFIWGGTDMFRIINDFNNYFLDPNYTGSKALTKATTIEVNKYLPSFLLFKAAQWNTSKITITATRGATSNALTPSNLDGQLNTQYLATTYAEGDWILKRTDGPWWGPPYNAIAQKYRMIVKNDACVKEKIQKEEFIYLRWLNSLGGYSFMVFEVTARSIAVAPRTRYRDYTYGFITDDIAQSDTETLSKDGQVSLTIGRGQVGWDQYEDLEDLLTSIEVLRWNPTYQKWIPVQISGGSSGDRSKQYNDFACTLTMPQNFNQKR